MPFCNFAEWEWWISEVRTKIKVHPFQTHQLKNLDVNWDLLEKGTINGLLIWIPSKNIWVLGGFGHHFGKLLSMLHNFEKKKCSRMRLNFSGPRFLAKAAHLEAF